MLRTLDKRLDALTPPAADALLQRFYAACCATYRSLSLREYMAMGLDNPPELQAKAAELDRVHGAYTLEAQCEALLSPAEVERRMFALDQADSHQAEPAHPVGRLYRRFAEAEIDRLCAAEEGFRAMLLEIAAAYIDVDKPMGEQGL